MVVAELTEIAATIRTANRMAAQGLRNEFSTVEGRAGLLLYICKAEVKVLSVVGKVTALPLSSPGPVVQALLRLV